MAETSQPDSGSVRSAAAAAVTPDALTADLLARHSANEKLTPAEYGKLGAFKAKLKAVFAGKAGPEPKPAGAASGPGQSAAVVALGASEAPVDSLVDPAIDPGLCKRTAAAILARADAVAVRYVSNAASKAGATGVALDRFRLSATLPQADRQLIVDLSPDIAAELGIDPHKFPLLIASGVLLAHGATLWLAVDELKGLAAERSKQKGNGESLPGQTTMPVIRQAVATTPPGSAPEVQGRK